MRESEWGPETRRKGGQRERGGRGGERGGAVGKGLFEEKGGKREEAMGGLGRVVQRCFHFLWVGEELVAWRCCCVPSI